MSEKFEAFRAALKVLCEEHRVILCPELYYPIQVWDADDTEQCWIDNLVDRTTFPREGA